LLGVALVALGITSRYQDVPESVRDVSMAVAPVPPSPRDLGWARANPTVPIERSPFRFTEITGDSGIEFVHVSGMTEDKHFPTAYGSGVALFDFDNDGRLDLYFATATRLPVGTARTGANRLYRNVGGSRFQDVTEQSGVGFAGYCQGIAVGDIDNDGDQDLFLCNYRSNVLYLNRGDGTFQDISKRAGIAGTGWSTAGAFLDYDNDGDLDLYVARFGEWKLPDDDRFCGGRKEPGAPGPEKIRIYCSPKMVPPVRHLLYRNNGNLSFTDVALAAGLGREDGRGLGVVATDLNEDGRIDLYVANDNCPNFVFFNRGDGTFEDCTETSGAGYGPAGQTRAGMGVDAEDLDGDGSTDLVVTNYFNEGTSVFISRGSGLFEEKSRARGMLHDSLLWVAWGCVLADFDNDGWPDCFAATGHVDDNLHLLGLFNPHAQPALLHRNLNGSRFQLATRDAGSYFESDHVGRGVAAGDIDDDGDTDLLVSHRDGPPALLRNDTPTPNHWIRLRLVGFRSNRDAIGARVEAKTQERTIIRQRKGGTSYASAHDPRLLIGLGPAATVERITVRWPSGTIDQHENLPADTEILIREGATLPEVVSRSVHRRDGPAVEKPGATLDGRTDSTGRVGPD
jgi:hypothetical protein